MTKKIMRGLSILVEACLVMGSVVIVGMVTAEVVLRKITGGSLIFTEELTRYLMVWVVFLGAAIGIRDGAHIKIRVLINRFSPRWQVRLGLLAHLLNIIFLAVLGLEGAKILPRQLYQMCITFDLPIFYFYLAIPVGCVLMLIFMLPRFKATWTGQEVAGGQTPD